MPETKLDRRGFLAGAAGLTGVALSVGAWKPVFAMETAVGPRELVPAAQKVGFVQLTLGETQVGHIFSAEGGNATADVVNEKVGNDVFTRKHLGNVKYEPITLSVGIHLDKRFYDWIASSLTSEPAVRSGSIAGATENFRVFTRTDFFNALITEVGMPALDAASKDAAKMKVTFAPDLTRQVAPTGTIPPGPNVHNQKWLASNFKFTINGVDTSGVTKIDALNWKWDLRSADPAGGGALEPFSLEIPSIKLTMTEARAQGFEKWHTDFVIKGNNGPENEKVGSLSFLSTDLKTEFFRLDLSGLGIFALDPDPLVPSSGVRHVTAQLYCDKFVFSAKV